MSNQGSNQKRSERMAEGTAVHEAASARVQRRQQSLAASPAVKSDRARLSLSNILKVLALHFPPKRHKLLCTELALLLMLDGVPVGIKPDLVIQDVLKKIIAMFTIELKTGAKPGGIKEISLWFKRFRAQKDAPPIPKSILFAHVLQVNLQGMAVR